MKQTGINKPNQLERISALEKNAEALSMGVRVSQMLLQQLLQRITQLEEKMTFLVGANTDTQYRALAMQNLLGVDVSKLQEEADKIRLDEWEKASDEDTKKRSLVQVDSVDGTDCVVAFTSSTPDLPEDRGVFRSKITLSDIGNPDSAAAFIGKKPGDVFDVVLADQRHVVTLLDVLKENNQSTQA